MDRKGFYTTICKNRAGLTRIYMSWLAIMKQTHYKMHQHTFVCEITVLALNHDIKLTILKCKHEVVEASIHCNSSVG